MVSQQAMLNINLRNKVKANLSNDYPNLIEIT